MRSTVVGPDTTNAQPPEQEQLQSLASCSFVANRAGLRAVAAALGEASRAGDVFALVGPLGAGKTLFAQAAVHGAGVGKHVRVTSPTFAIMQVYEGKFTVIHADLYRLAGPDELDEIGLFSLGADGLVIVEWPERAGDQLPAALWIDLERSETSRLVRRVTVRTQHDTMVSLVHVARDAWAQHRARVTERIARANARKNARKMPIATPTHR